MKECERKSAGSKITFAYTYVAQPLFLYMEQANDPEHLFEKRENLIRLQNALASLTEEEKELIWLLYLCKEPLTETQAASVLHISQPAIHKRKKKILEKMKSFWL